MKPDDWPRVKQIFQDALDLPREKRSGYLETAAGGDEDLRREVESLLASADESGDFLDEPAAEYVAFDAQQNAGRRIGPYQIVREIGSGGMGSVYLAERVDEFQQKVALKLLRAGMDSRMVVSRFRYERQILAGLDHPNIARLLDGGAADNGQPFFVMEYVEGVPIDAYCGKHALGITARVDLFRQVCAAVQYAHQRLVVHRDIKPGNILVGADGVPKLLDFGIAKVLREDAPQQTALTQVGMRLMTPEYASPEQVRGLAITTASDVYSLGLVLYELLAGKPPFHFETRTPLEFDRLICETDPPRPSALQPELRGDLEVIVLKALEKDPSRRYQSAEQLGEDLRRYREGVPILARPHTLLYRTGKFVRRNRTAVMAGVLVFASLTGGLIVAERERARAERRFNDVRRLAGSFLFEFDEKIQNLAGATEARKLVVARALEYLRSLAAEAGRDIGLQHEVAEAYLKVGDVQGNPYVSNLNDLSGALESYGQALAIAQTTLSRKPRDLVATRYVARAHRAMAEVLPLRGDLQGAVGHLKQATALLESAGADEKVRFELASAYEMLGDVSGHAGIPNLGDRAAAEAAYQKALVIDQALAAQHPDNRDARRGAAVQRMKIADVTLDAGDAEGAIREYRAAASELDALSAAEPDNARLRRTAASVHRKLGGALEMAGQPAQAMEAYAATARALEGLMQIDPANGQAKMDYAVVHRAAGDLEYRLGNKAASVAAYRKALETIGPLAEAQPGNLMLRSRHGELMVYVGDVAYELHQADAAPLCRRGLAILKEIADREGASAGNIITYVENLIDCPVPELKNPALAAAYGRRAVELSGGTVLEYLEQTARAYQMAGDSRSAADLERKALAMAPEGPVKKRAQDLLDEFEKRPATKPKKP